MVTSIQTVTPRQQPMAQRPITQAFTPHVPQSRIVQALLAQGASQAPIRSPIEGVGRLAQTLTGALLEKKEAKRAQEQQQARIAGLGDLASILAQPDMPPLPEGVQGPPAATQQQQLAQFVGQQQDPALAQQAFGLQQALAKQQAPAFTNVQVDPSGQPFGIREGIFQPVPTAGAQGQVAPFGAAKREIDARKLVRKEKESDRAFTSGLRGENRTTSKAFFKQEEAISRIRAVTRDKEGELIQSPAASLALVFNYMKMLDPESVVRESEFRTAEQARGWFSRLDEESQARVPTQFVQFIQGATAEGRMTPEQIIDFTQRAEDIFESAGATNASQITTIAASARDNNVAFEKVFSKGQRSALDALRLQGLTDEELDEEIRRASR